MHRAVRTAVTGATFFAALTLSCTAPQNAGLRRSVVALTVFASSDSIAVRTLARGLTYVFTRESDGPFAIHTIEVDRHLCTPVLRAAKAGPPLAERATTSALARGLTAINADFFEIPVGTTIGAHASGSQVLIGPGRNRPVFAVTAHGYVAGPVTLDAWMAVRADTLQLEQVNRPHAGPTLYTHWAGDIVTDSAGRVLVVRSLSDGRGLITAIVAPGEPVGMAEGTLAVAHGAAWTERRAVGDTIEWRARVRTRAGEDVIEAAGGFPLLRTGGRDVLAEQPDVRPSFGEQRHPRTAIGWSADRLWWIVVDGRQATWSDGMTLRELADVFGRLGAAEAMNLDGGGSSALVVRGRPANRPSDGQGERPVGNALVLEGCRVPVEVVRR